MIKAKFTSKMRDSLRKLIGDSLISYNGAFMNQTAYGNVQLNTKHFSLELRNEVRALPLFAEVEDISSFSCVTKPAGFTFEPYCKEPWKTVMVDEKITDVSIISDTITVNNNEYSISFDMAVIITTENHQFVFSRGWFFSETIDASVDKNFNDIYPICRVIADWNDDGNRKVSVIRESFSLLTLL